MTLLWHMAKKDLRHLRWPIAGWVLLTVVEAVMRAVGPLFIDVTRDQPWYTLDSLTNFVPLIRGMLYVVIVALIVLADPLVGTDAFWLTRPIPRRTLLASKLLVAVLILVVPSLLTEIALMGYFRVPSLEIAAVVPDILLGSIVLLLVFVFAATLAGSLTQFILGIIGVIAAGWIGLAAYVVLVVSRTHDFETPLPIHTSNPTGEILLLLLNVILFAWTTWYHYRTRQRGRSLLFAIAAVGVTLALAEIMPPMPWLSGGPPELPAALQDPTVTSLRLTRPIRHVFDEQSPFFDNPRHRRIAAPLVLDGVPNHYAIEPFTVGATVRMPGGAVLHGQRSQPMFVDVTSGHARPGAVSLLSGGSMTSRRPDATIEIWPMLFQATIDQVRQAGDEPGEYEGTFLYDFTRIEPLSTSTLQREMQFFDGSRSFTMWVIGDRGAACSVLVRRTSLQRRGWPVDQAVLSDRYLDRARGQGATSQPARRMTQGLHFGGGWSTNSDSGEWFHITYQVLNVLPEGTIYGQPAPARLSCADVDLVLRRYTYAGRLVRTLTLPGFRLQAQPGDLTGDESNLW